MPLDEFMLVKERARALSGLIIHILLQNFQPKVVTDLDEQDLAKELEKLEKENAEVDGDDDNPDDEDEQDEP
jgi:hypothetical protein